MLFRSKVRELSAMLDLGDYTIDINRPFEVTQLLHRLEALVAGRLSVAAAVRTRSEQLRARALADFARTRSWLAVDTGGG